MSDTAIVIFAKAPIPGLVKTRLAGYLTPEECAELYKCFFLDIVASIDKLSYSLFVSFTPSEAENTIRELVSSGISVFPQAGNDLGERMFNAALYISGLGKTKIIFIGADIPFLNEDHIAQAVKSLESYDLCIGPAYDGGYYLIGLKKPEPMLFKGIAWGTAKVLNQTKGRIEELGLKCSLLPILRDIDTIDDLACLSAQLHDDSIPAFAPNTREYLEKKKVIRNLYQTDKRY